MANRIIHSHTAINQYQTCPFQYKTIRIDKAVREPETEALRLGNVVHKAMEAYVKDGTPLPLQASNWQKIAEFIRDIPGEKHAELKLCVDEAGEQCGYWDKQNAYFRGNADLLIKRGSTVIAVDYKTGKSKYGTKRQDDVYAWLVFALMPEIDTVHTRFIYPKDRNIIRNTYTRDMIPKLREFVDEVAGQIAWSQQHDAWPKNAGPLCGYCAVAAAGLCSEGEKSRKFSGRR